MDGKSLNILEDLISKLKEIVPGAFSEDKLDIEHLKQLLGENVHTDQECYQLNWSGKSDAFRILQQPATSTLALNQDCSVNHESTGHIFIEGENLEVLKILQKAYYNKIKFIYIDPPYNTGSDSFIYTDDFSETKEEYLKRLGAKDAEGYLLKEELFRENKKENGQFHSNWLSMMMPRLFLSRNLLREDGVLIVSIDDNEAYTIKLLLDEIYGEENFAGNIIWNSTKSVTNTALLSVSHTHNLVYFKSIEYFKKNRYEFRLPDTPDGFSNPDHDPRGLWKADPFQVEGERPNQLYEIKNPNTGQIYKPNPGNSWKNDYVKFIELMKDNRIVFGASGEAGPQRKRFWSEAQQRGRVAKSLWTDTGTTSNGTIYLEKLLGKKLFTNPKPVDLIQRFIQLGTSSENDIVLDFFGGSGTTAEAVLRQNIVDNKRRKFIFVTLPEKIDDTVQSGKNALSLGLKTIAEVAKYRIDKAIESIKIDLSIQQKQSTDSGLMQADLGYKHFSIRPSHFKRWRSDVIINTEDLESQVKLLNNTVILGSVAINIIYEILLKNGYDLNTRIEELKDITTGLYLIQNDLVIATKSISLEQFYKVIDLKPNSFWAIDEIFNNNDSLKTNIQLKSEATNINFKSI